MLALIVVSALARLLLAASVGLSVDESYSVAISRALEPSYLDHPPLHLWLVGLWARLTGSEQPLLLRLPDIALFALSTWLLFRLSARAYGERAGWWASVAFNLAPLFSLNDAGIVPDAPLVCMSLLSVWVLLQALEEGGTARRWWLLAGSAAGLALLSKYTAIFPIAAVGAWLLWQRPRLLRHSGPWLALACIVLLFTPVLWWNHAHGWASFAFQGGRARPDSFSVPRALATFGAQLLYLLPWTGVALILALARAVHPARARSRQRAQADGLFALLAAPAIVLFSLLALFTKVLPHWSAIGWLFAFPLLGAALAALEPRHRLLLRGVSVASAALLLAAVTLFTLQARSGSLAALLPALATHDPTLDLLDWRELGSRMPAARQAHADVIATVSWIDAGKADYALGGALPVLCLTSSPHQYAYRNPPADFAGHDALIIADAGRPDWLRLARPWFRRIEPAADLIVHRAGAPALTLHTAWGFSLTPQDER